MEHIAAFMILVACSGDYDQCSEQPAPAVAYETTSQCQAELSPSIRMMAAKHEHALGKCVEIDPALFYEDVEIVWDVSEAGEIEVALEVIDPVLSVPTLAQSEPYESNQSLN